METLQLKWNSYTSFTLFMKKDQLYITEYYDTFNIGVYKCVLFWGCYLKRKYQTGNDNIILLISEFCFIIYNIKTLELG